MKIVLNKFGTNLTSRQAGREAFAAFSPSLREVDENEKIEIDFEGVISFSPGWGDEFLSSLLKQHGERLVLLNTENKSVEITIKFLEKVNEVKFNISKRS